MPNDDNKIILEFPATNVEIELGETITFDNISGFLNSDRVTYDGESLTDEITHLENDKADASYVDTELAKKMDKDNPTGTGSFSMNRQGNTPVGARSATLGYNNTASGNYSTAEGNSTVASGVFSHAEGQFTEARGSSSHTEGRGVIATHRSQSVFGEYNATDTSTARPTAKGNYVEIVGNGTTDGNRSNARTLDWEGNETLAGDVIINGNQSVSGEISRLDGRITDLPEAMVFKGTLGVGGTIQSLPTASAENEGWTFKCITAGTYAGLTLKVGDTVTCFNPPNTSVYEWEKTGSQDTDTDTWRNIKINGVEKLGNGISSGAVDFEDTANVKFEYDANGNKIKAKLDGIYTESDVDDLLDDKADADNTYTKAQVDAIIDSILPTDEASGAVAFFKTSLEKQLVSIDVDNSATKIYQFGFNLFDKTTTKNDAYISDSDGTQKPATGSKCTDYIPIVGDTEFYVRSDQTQGAWGAFYDENKTFISAWTGYTPVGSYKAKTSPANARFVRFTIVRNNSGDENTFCFSVSGSDNGQYEAYNPNSNVYLVADKDDIVTFEGYNTIFADNGNVDVFFKCSVVDYVNAHSGNGNRSLGVNLSKGGGGSEEETDEGEDTEKTKEIDEPKEEIKTIGDDANIKKIGGE